MIRRPGRLGLLGRSLAHTLSPRLHSAALRSAGIDLEYEVLDIPASALDTTIEALADVSAAGNVTIPYKAAVLARCDRLSSVATRAGAVNTFWFEHGELVGDNTDVGGFTFAVARLLGSAPRDITVGLLGAGGAAGAVLAAVAEWTGSRVLVHNRTIERAEAVCARFSSVARTSDPEELAAVADLVVNATPIGLRDDAMPIDPATLRPDAAVLDLVYRHGETRWVHAARSLGHPAQDGLPMLVEQAALAFERWFGLQADRDAMWAAVR